MSVKHSSKLKLAAAYQQHKQKGFNTVLLRIDRQFL